MSLWNWAINFATPKAQPTATEPPPVPASGPLHLEVLSQLIEELKQEYGGILLRKNDGTTEAFTFRAIIIRLATLTKRMVGVPVASREHAHELSGTQLQAVVNAITRRVDEVLLAQLEKTVERVVAVKLDEMGVVPAPKISYGDYIHKRGMFAVTKKTPLPAPPITRTMWHPALTTQRLAELKASGEVQVEEKDGYRFFTYGPYTWVETL